MDTDPPPSDITLQLALAKELPELIEITGGGCYPSSPIIHWKHSKSKYSQRWVNDREWDWITKECWRKYKKSMLDNKFQCSIEMFSAEESWQKSAISYFKIIGREII